MENREKCGNCVWHIPGKDDWICSCENSEAYGMETEYTDDCERVYQLNYQRARRELNGGGEHNVCNEV